MRIAGSRRPGVVFSRAALRVMTEGSGWYAVRCLFALDDPPGGRSRMYEERITLWRADSLGDAIRLAEAEAQAYVEDLGGVPQEYLGLAQAFALFDVPGVGAEVFSLIRDSGLPVEEYLSAYFDTGTEHQHEPD